MRTIYVIFTNTEWGISPLKAFKNKSDATRYCAKYNRILKKYKEYYKKYEVNKLGLLDWIDDKYIGMGVYDKWYSVKNTYNCSYEQVNYID